MPDTPRKRGRPKGSTKSKEPITQKSGVVYVYDQGFTQWSDPTLTPEKIIKMMRNPYVMRVFRQATNLLFPPGDVLISVDDSEENTDEDAAKKLRKMTNTRLLNIKSVAKKCWNAWYWWGVYVTNPVFLRGLDQDGWKVLEELRHLKSRSFDCQPQAVTDGGISHKIISRGELLPGIAVYDDEIVRYWQTDNNGAPKPLTNVTHVSAPHDPTEDIAGMPIVYSMLSIVEMLNFAHLCQQQKLNRVGAPSIFIKVTNPIDRRDPVTGKVTNDIDYVKTILQNYGRNNSFVLLENMEVIPLEVKESESAIETINMLTKLLNDQMSTTSLISTDGSNKIGGSDEATATLLTNFYAGFLEPIEEFLKNLLQDVLRYNGFVDYSVTIKFPRLEFKNSELNFKIAEFAANSHALGVNEVRMLLGYEPGDEEFFEVIKNEWEALGASKDVTDEDTSRMVQTEDTSQEPDPEEAPDEPEQITNQANYDPTENEIAEGWAKMLSDFEAYLIKKVGA